MDDKELQEIKRVAEESILSPNARLTLRLISTIEGLKGEIKRLKRILSSHGPEGHNYTNAEYVRLLQERKAYKDALEIAMSQNQSPEVYKQVQKLINQ